ncbi:MAG: methanogenesis marker 17 protein [Methanobrevibacter sp. CfCl-M3]
MLVESNDKDGAEVYEMIIKQILQDLQLSPSIKDMKSFVNPNEVVFIIAIKMDKTSTSIKLNEVSSITYDKEENKTTIKISDENYLPNILKLLWREFSRDQLYQPDRYTILLDDDVTFLKDLIVFSPKENLKMRLIDAIFRIIPEGFRVLRELSKDDIVAIVATDEMLKDEWILKCQDLINELKD